MKFLNNCQKKRDQIKPEVVDLEDLGVSVEVLAPFLSQRLSLIQNEKATDKKMYSFLVVANCLSENGIRQIDVMDYEEIKAGLDVLTEKDFMKLFTKCQSISKTNIQDVIDAKKN
jgi:hypothetical protein